MTKADGLPHRAGVALALVAALIALAPRGAGPPPEGGPRLIVLLVVDQMRYEYLDRYAPLFKGGLRRLLQAGVSFTEAHFAHAHTVTGAGHATLATGLHPGHHGIVGNWWLDRATREQVYCVEDEQDKVSPRRLLGTALGDWLKARDPASRVYALSEKSTNRRCCWADIAPTVRPVQPEDRPVQEQLVLRPAYTPLAGPVQRKRRGARRLRASLAAAGAGSGASGSPGHRRGGPGAVTSGLSSCLRRADPGTRRGLLRRVAGLAVSGRATGASGGIRDPERGHWDGSGLRTWSRSPSPARITSDMTTARTAARSWTCCCAWTRTWRGSWRFLTRGWA